MHETSKPKLTRRAFVAGAAVLAGLSPFSVLAGSGKHRWRMAVPWSSRERVLLQGADRFVRQVSLLTESRLAISMHASGTLAGSDGVLDAVLSGKADCGQVFACELARKSPAAEWFFSVPFGLSADGLNHWFYAGEGLPLLSDTARGLGLFALPMGDVGPRPTGWFARSLDSGAAGLAAAFPGRLAAAVFERCGGRAGDFSISQGPEDLYRGDIAGLGSRGAYLDLGARFNASAERLYLPCGLTPSGRMLFIARRDAFNSLTAILRKIVRAACAQEDLRLQADLAYAGSEAVRRVRSGAKTDVERVPSEVVSEFRRRAGEALDEVASADHRTAAIHGKYKKYLAETRALVEAS